MKLHFTGFILFFALVAMATVGWTKDAPEGSKGPALEKATFAGGCFWCMEPAFDSLEGVKSVMPGYTGGSKVNPTYEEVSSGSTGHTESIQISYDPSKVSYSHLLDVFWHNIDPLAKDSQFCDTGNQYRSAIFYHNEEQKKLALQSKATLEASERFKGKTIYTEIVPASTFYPAEGYHQKYYKKNPVRYSFYRFSCGRDERLKEVWGKEAGGH
jgi:peptide-methionine (S)-S-oxide reductase